jgi:hypothetical protein
MDAVNRQETWLYSMQLKLLNEKADFITILQSVTSAWIINTT